MKDIQSQLDSRRINIAKVGVKEVSYPIRLKDKAQKTQHTIANASLYVNLPHKFKGTHMSRFVEILNEFHGAITIRHFSDMLCKMKERLDAEASHLELEFPYFFRHGRYGHKTLTRYRCRMHGSLTDENELSLQINVPIHLPVCGAKKQNTLSAPGAWGEAQVTVRLVHFYWIEDLVELVSTTLDQEVEGSEDDSVSLRVRSLAQAIAQSLEKVAEISWFSVTVKNYCSEFSSFAVIESTDSGTA